MALTIVVRTAEPGEGAELSLTLDAPRLVIGRGEGCDLRLPDPSVSSRHASLRQRGGEYVLVDEGSANGTYLGPVRLPPQTPRAVRTGEMVRIGRIWMEIRIEAVLVKGSTAVAAKELALELVARGLGAQGEDPWPRLDVVDGPSAGRTLSLQEPGRHYLVGRSKDVDLPLDDDLASRRHLDVVRKGELLLVRDIGSAAPALLDGAPLGPGDTPWRPGQVLSIGKHRVAFAYPAAEALAELERSPEEKMRPGEAPPQPGNAEPSADTPAPEAATSADETPAPGDTDTPGPPLARGSKRPAARRDAESWSMTDGAVILLALGVLALSVLGAFWLLR